MSTPNKIKSNLTVGTPKGLIDTARSSPAATLNDNLLLSNDEPLATSPSTFGFTPKRHTVTAIKKSLSLAEKYNKKEQNGAFSYGNENEDQRVARSSTTPRTRSSLSIVSNRNNFTTDLEKTKKSPTSNNVTPLKRASSKRNTPLSSRRATPKTPRYKQIIEEATEDSKANTSPSSPRRSPRIQALRNTTHVNAKATLGTPQYQRLKQKRRVEKQLERFYASSEDEGDRSDDEGESSQDYDDEESKGEESESDQDDNDTKNKRAMRNSPSTDGNNSSSQEDEIVNTPVHKRKSNTSSSTGKRRKGTIDQESDSQDDDQSEDEPQSKKRKTLCSSYTHARKVPKAQPNTPTIERLNDAYFGELARARTMTSNNTLSNAKLPEITLKTLKSTIESLELPFAKETEGLKSLYKSNFQQWYFQLLEGFNLLYYGFGSKVDILSRFMNFVVDNGAMCVQIFAFNPIVNIRSIIKHIGKECCRDEIQLGKNLVTQVQQIREYFEQNDKHLFLFMHNIESDTINNENAQYLLSELCGKDSFGNGHIHLVASVDHQNGMMLWDNEKAAKFNFVIHDLTTFEPYKAETSYENSLLATKFCSDSVGGGSGSSLNSIGLSGITFVLNSLTENARRVFKELLVFQLDEASNNTNNNQQQNKEDQPSDGGNGNHKGLSLDSLQLLCSEKFIVTSRTILQTILVEFRDHDLVKGDDDGLYIPLGVEILETIKENNF